MFKLSRVISGGQTGVDQAALRAARERGLALGGWCPPGRACEAGIIPSSFPLQETPEDRSPGAPDTPRSQRTEWNVRDSDATLILQPGPNARADPGTDWTQRCARRYGRPLLICDPADPTSPDTIKRWLRAFSIRTLNVAGPGERAVPGIGDQAHALLVQVFSDD
ncbi:MAG TPA: putative molybdenum carrier protein [Blastocatellia bacterium]|nr:putative molybdenum carrier protein [Blastocatellia bacterium]